MNRHDFTLAGTGLTALSSGVLWIPGASLLAVSDLHLGKAERVARLGGALLPPYETIHTLNRLEAEIAETDPRTVVLLGDSFDDIEAAQGLAEDVLDRFRRMAAGRQLIWIAGNHDPGPTDVPGTHVREHREGALTFRHIALRDTQPGEVSGHYHPKARLKIKGQFISRPCFLVDGNRVILPAFGTYTGGLDAGHPDLAGMLGPDAVMLVTGRRITALPYAVLGCTTVSR